MKKVIFSAAALMLASAFSFAGTPETKTEAKAKPDVKTETVLKTYHYVSKSGDLITFAEGPSTSCPNGNQNPCEWTSTEELSSPMTADEIDNNTDIQVSSRRN